MSPTPVPSLAVSDAPSGVPEGVFKMLPPPVEAAHVSSVAAGAPGVFVGGYTLVNGQPQAAVWALGDGLALSREVVPSTDCTTVSDISSDDVVAALVVRQVGDIQCDVPPIVLLRNQMGVWDQFPSPSECLEEPMITVVGNVVLVSGTECGGSAKVWSSTDGIHWQILAQPQVHTVFALAASDAQLVTAGSPADDDAATTVEVFEGDAYRAEPRFGIYDVAFVDAHLVGVGLTVESFDGADWHLVGDPGLDEVVLLSIAGGASAALAAGQSRSGGGTIGGPVVVWEGNSTEWRQVATLQTLPVVESLDIATTDTETILLATNETSDSLWIRRTNN